MIQGIIDEIGTWTSPASELEKRGIKGDRNDCTTCPMANYIASVMPREVKWVKVEGTTTVIGYHDSERDNETFVNPRNMVRFVEWFDEGDYPELDNDPDDDWYDEECPCGCMDEPWD